MSRFSSVLPTYNTYLDSRFLSYKILSCRNSYFGNISIWFLLYNYIPVYFHFQVLVVIANPTLEFSFTSLISLGSTFSWKVVVIFYFWAFLSLKVPSKIFKGPATPNGYVPLYSANGFQFYLVSLITFLVFVFFYPSICVEIFQQFSNIVQVLSLTSLILCGYLVVKGKNFPETKNDPLQNLDKPLPYLFYRGIELHPRFFDVDIKQVSI